MKNGRPRASCRITVLIIAILAMLGALAVPAGSLYAAELITLIGGTKRTLPGDADTPTINFPIELTEAGAASSVLVTVTEVLRDNVVLAETSVVASIVDDRLALVLEVKDATSFAQAADYSITVLLTDDKTNQQGLTLTLSRPAATLDVGGAVEVVDFTGLLSNWNADRRPKLELSVEQGAAIQSLSARQVERTEGRISLTAECSTGGESKSCPLTAAQPVDLKTAVGVNGVLTLGYKLVNFPLGTTVRTVELRSPQLSAPATVSFKVTKRRSPLLIPLIVIIGLLFGILVRKVLVKLIAGSNRNKAKNELSALIMGFRRKYADPDFRRKLDEIEAKLESKRLSLEKIEAQRQQLAEALDVVNTSLLSIRDSANLIASAVTGAWTVPPRVLPAIDSVEEAVGRVRSCLDSRNAQAASEKLVEATNELGKGRDDALDWIGRYRGAITTAQDAIDGLNGSWYIIDLHRSLDEALQAAVVADADDFRKTLETTQKLTRDWQRDVEPSIRSAINANAYRDLALASDALNALKESDPVDRLGKSTDHLKKLLRKPAEQTARGMSPGNVTKESARQAIEGAAPTAVGEDTTVLLPAYDIGTLGQLVLLPQRIIAGAVGFFAELFLFIVLASITAAVAYATSASNWVGGTAQIIALFGWAFTIDVTAGAVMSMFGKASPTPPTFDVAKGSEA